MTGLLSSSHSKLRPMSNHLPQRRIDPKAKAAWRFSGLIFGLFWFTIPAGYYFISAEAGNHSLTIQILLSATTFLVYLFFGFLAPGIRWKRWRYDLSENEIDLMRGYIIRKRTLIPVNRVQHVDTSQGPIYRRFALSSVKVSTAATTHEIPALDEETAAEVRNSISQLVRQAKEDV